MHEGSHAHFLGAVLGFVIVLAGARVAEAGSGAEQADPLLRVPGSFSGPLQLEVTHNGDRTRYKLLTNFGYVDSNERRWEAKAGYETDGATIPRVLWTLVGNPYGDRYVEAAVIHDYYCDYHYRTWKDVHRVFYDAMRANKVGDLKAALMFYAVWRFGPRWKTEDIVACTPGPNENCAGAPLTAIKVTVSSSPTSFDTSREEAAIRQLKAKLVAGAMAPVDIENFEASQPALERPESSLFIPKSGLEDFRINRR